MLNRLSRFLALYILALFLVVAAPTQPASTIRSAPRGYLQGSQLAQPRPRPMFVHQSTGIRPYTGDFKFEFTVKLLTQPAAGQKVYCYAVAGTYDADSSGAEVNEYDESASATAAINGSNANCVVDIPYAWSLVSGSTDSVYFEYSLVIAPSSPTNAGPFYNAGIRSHNSLLPSLAGVPANGSTTPVALNITL